MEWMVGDLLRYLKKYGLVVLCQKFNILSSFGSAEDRELAQNNILVLGYIEKPLAKNRLA